MLDAAQKLSFWRGKKIRWEGIPNKTKMKTKNISHIIPGFQLNPLSIILIIPVVSNVACKKYICLPLAVALISALCLRFTTGIVVERRCNPEFNRI